MKLIAVLGLTLAAVGCRSYVEIFEVTAERGKGEEVVVRFKARRDVTRMAQFTGATLGVRREGVGDWDYARASRLVCVEPKTEAPGSFYSFQADFPLEQDQPRRRRLRYDLSEPGRYVLEFSAGGGMCGGPGGFYTNEVRIEYVVP